MEVRQRSKRFGVAQESGFAGALKHQFKPRYREVVAVDRFDRSMRAGEGVGDIGPNGLT
jgi:ABC-type uncharacterized transport system ATPase subunit